MSDILIKGMDMPKNCRKCNFCVENGGIGISREYYCNATDFLRDLDINNLDKKAEFCPLDEITTPHGRLIDTDEFFAVLSDIRAKCIYDREVYMVNLIAEELNKAQTIIEAEED